MATNGKYTNKANERLIRDKQNQLIQWGQGQHVDGGVLYERMHMTNILSLKLYYFSLLQGAI